MRASAAAQMALPHRVCQFAGQTVPPEKKGLRCALWEKCQLHVTWQRREKRSSNTWQHHKTFQGCCQIKMVNSPAHRPERNKIVCHWSIYLGYLNTLHCSYCSYSLPSCCQSGEQRETRLFRAPAQQVTGAVSSLRNAAPWPPCCYL